MQNDVELFMETELDDLILEAPGGEDPEAAASAQSADLDAAEKKLNAQEGGEEKPPKEDATKQTQDNTAQNKAPEDNANNPQQDNQQQNADPNAQQNMQQPTDQMNQEMSPEEKKKVFKEKMELSKRYYDIKKALRVLKMVNEMLRTTNSVEEQMQLRELEQRLIDWTYIINKDNIKDFDKWINKEFAKEVKKILNIVPDHIKKMYIKNSRK